MKVAQFPASYLHQIGRKAFWAFSVEHSFDGPVPKGTDHKANVSLYDTEIKPAYQ